MRAAVARIDDLLNPIVVKELRQAVQGRFVSTVFLLFLAVQLVVMGIYLFTSGIADQTQTLDYEAGMSAFAWLQGILLTTTIFFVPIYTGVRLASERSDENVDLMFVTTLRPRSIITGKLAAATVITLMIFSACAPFMTFTYLLRGIDLHIIFLTIVLDFFIVLACVQFMIFLAVVTANRVAKIMVGILGLLAVLIALYFGLAGTIALIIFGPPPDVDIYLMIGAVVLSLVLASGIMFTWSVGLISPLSANRTLPSRIFTLISWLVGGAIAAVWGFAAGSDIPMSVWVSVAGSLIGVTLLIAINEREEWSIRVARTIPRFPLFRLPLFLLYSGAAGGVLFCVLLVVLTALVVIMWRTYTGIALLAPGFGPGIDTLLIAANTNLIFTLYLYCYCMSAVFCRNTIFRRAVGREHTWVVALTLFIAMSILPFVLSFVILQGEWDYHRYIVVLLGNPFVAIGAVNEDTNYPEYAILFYSFVLGWAVLVSVLNLVWVVDQLARFRPPKLKRAQTEAPAAPNPEVVIVEPVEPAAPPPMNAGADTSVQNLSPMS